ncbi:hypothetical protein H1O16_gp204 [Burkholderia phage BcepSaruman]|uniref:Uncharacterized protein n=1 Tax=Burkholderia phage BcepSaruman TaxID=2530032 RepID=A0A4D5ZEC7_9CAUD|nr:hypothetical protein H1O16_gp204 [Burkholderia phage BcepSaruman]QBX06617.1 hypothetical protein BcepSaruman_204 [Burkholderia phage BcepSaruman]
MGLEYYALNHARAEAVSLGRVGFRFDALLNVTDQAEFERACFESLVASGYDYARAAEFAHDFYDFGADEIWNDGQDVYEYFSCYRVVDALDHEEIGSKLGDYFVRSGMLPVEALSLRHPRVRIVLGRAQITQPNLN